MTPKLKAIELFEKYDNTLTYLESKTKAKQCALVAVDEIITLIQDIYCYDFDILNPYWQEVKNEIEKI
jgi:hypothetical protein